MLSSVPDFDEFAFVLSRPFSNDGSPVPVECLARCKTVKREKGILVLSSGDAYMVLHTYAELPTGRSNVGTEAIEA